jgi:hypothetical protein
LTEIKQYKPSTLEKIDLPTHFVIPNPPKKPELEVAQSVVVETSLQEEEWPRLVDPIDNPELYNGILYLI